MSKFKVGDRVICTEDEFHNYYLKGDRGVVDAVNEEGVFVAFEDNGWCRVDEEEIELEKAMSRVDKVFEILGLEADEEFKLCNEGNASYRITRYLQIQRKDWGVADFTLAELLASELELIKIPQKTKLELLHEEMLNKEHDFSLYSLMCEDCYDDDYILQGDCGTREEMEFLKEKRAVEAEIRFLQKKYPDGEWNGVNEHWYCCYDARNKKIDIDYTVYCNDNNFFFPTEESVKEMIETVTEERYKKYILEI